MMAEQAQSAGELRNSEFLAALARGAPNGSSLWVCGFGGNPHLTEASNWAGRPYDGSMASMVDAWGDRNTYFSTAALTRTAAGELRRRKTNFARLLALVVDDVILDDIHGRVSWVIETSPGKFQAGILIDSTDRDAARAAIVDTLLAEFGLRGMCRVDGSGNNAVRYVRMPCGINGKPREGPPWPVRAAQWNPEVVLSLADAAAAFGVDLDALRAPRTEQAEPDRQAQGELLRTLTSSILRGEILHDGLNRIAASLIATGMHSGAVVNHLRALMDCSLAARDERWAVRYADIPRAVETAAHKFKPDEQSPRATIELLDLAALERAYVQSSWLVKHILPAAALGVMFGASGTGKSFVAIDLGLHIAHGLKWMGKKTRKGRVLYVAAEGGAGVWKRVKAWHKACGRSWKGIDFYVLPRAVVIGQTCGEIVQAAAAIGIEFDLVIVDTLSQTFDGEENSANEVAGYFRALGDSFRAQWQCCVIAIHHSGHLATERPRGSSAIIANTDFMFGVFRDEQQMLTTVECHKQKDDEKFPPQTFKLSGVDVGFDEDGERVTSLCASHVADETQVSELKSEEAKSGRGGRDELILSCAQTGMTVQQWRLAAYSALPHAMDVHTKKVAFYRARDALIKTGRIDLGTTSGQNAKIVIVRESRS